MTPTVLLALIIAIMAAAFYLQVAILVYRKTLNDPDVSRAMRELAATPGPHRPWHARAYAAAVAILWPVMGLLLYLESRHR